jgi:hypothetical protein
VLLSGAAIFLTADRVSSANPRSLSGVVQTGGTSSSRPLPDVSVTLFEATAAQPTALGQATTDTSGRFTIRYTRSSSSSIFFVRADVGKGVQFVTILGPNLPASVTLNELTTVAASYSMDWVGPFRLALLETILRVADARASAGEASKR